MTSRRAKRLTPRHRSLARWTTLAWLLCAGGAFAVTESIDPAETGEHAAAEPEQAAADAPTEESTRASLHAPVSSEMKGELAGYARLAQKAVDESKWPLADHYLQLIADLPISMQEKEEYFLKTAESYAAAQQTGRAVAIYEKMAEAFPHAEATAEILFKLGMIYRESGATKLAISRFYNVLNSALKTDERGLEGSQALAKRAQWEIAETYFLAQDFPQARKFYELFSRLELNAQEQARVRFKMLHTRFLLGELPATVDLAKKFLADFPDDNSAPECRYVLANAQRELKRPQESLDTVVELLRQQQAEKDKSPAQWVLWQKRAGNEFANRFYAEGDYYRAVTIYQALARLNETPEWQWPVIYQMGLCFERMKLTERAAEAYKYIVEDAKKPGREAAKQPEAVRDLPLMAKWRGEQLVWRHDTTAELERVIGPVPAPKSEAAPAGNKTAANSKYTPRFAHE